MPGEITFHFDSGQAASWIISGETFDRLRAEILAESQTVLQLTTLDSGREVTIFRHKVEAFEFELIDARFDLSWGEPGHNEPTARSVDFLPGGLGR